MNRNTDTDVLADALIKKITDCDETCHIREFAGQWGCDIGNCDRCTGLAIELVYQRWKERNQDATV